MNHFRFLYEKRSFNLFWTNFGDMTETIIFSEKKPSLLTVFEIIEWGSLECRVCVMHDHLLGVVSVTGQKYFTFLSATSVVKLFFLLLYSPGRAKLLGNRFIRN